MRCAAERGKREFTDYLARFDPLDTAHNALMSARSICLHFLQTNHRRTDCARYLRVLSIHPNPRLDGKRAGLFAAGGG